MTLRQQSPECFLSVVYVTESTEDMPELPDLVSDDVTLTDIEITVRGSGTIAAAH